ncbi:MAG: DUF2156 domain-containing protein [Christensenellales bacterium]|jgi:hypothetical protein
MLHFNALKLEDKPFFEEYTLCHGYHNVEASFANIFLWGKLWNIKMAVDEYAMYLLLDNGKRFFMLPPYLQDCDINIGKPLKKCEEYMLGRYGTFIMKGFTEEIKNKTQNDCPGEYVFTADRANFEYVYLSSDLCKLEGKKYHAKRNHINKLIKNHSFTYRRYTNDDYESCIALERSWMQNKSNISEGLNQELIVIQNALLNLDALNLVCGLLFVDNMLQAFSIGEKFGDDMAIIHIEKANPDMSGAYALINREFAINEWRDVKYINREEDMGLEGLRKAKLSYYPVFLIKKYDCVKG